MKNYLVKALRLFNDYEGKDVNDPKNTFIVREKDSEFYCTKERFEYLNEKGAVMLLGIDKKKTSKK